jgi:hypothetical protein
MAGCSSVHVLWNEDGAAAMLCAAPNARSLPIVHFELSDFDLR